MLVGRSSQLPPLDSIHIPTPPSHNPSSVPSFPTFSHGSGEPWSFDFQSIDIPFLLDQYSLLFQQQDTMELYDYEDNFNNCLDNPIHRSANLAASNNHLEDFYQPEAVSTAQAPNPSLPFAGPPLIPSADLAPGFGMSLELPGPSQDESDWEMVPVRPDGHQLSPDSALSSSSGNPLEGPFQYIPWHSDQPQEVYSGYTEFYTSSPEAPGPVGLKYPITPPRPKNRGALSTERQQTSETRQMTACLRCQMERKRVRLFPQ